MVALFYLCLLAGSVSVMFILVANSESSGFGAPIELQLLAAVGAVLMFGACFLLYRPITRQDSADRIILDGTELRVVQIYDRKDKLAAEYEEVRELKIEGTNWSLCLENGKHYTYPLKEYSAYILPKEAE